MNDKFLGNSEAPKESKRYNGPPKKRKLQDEQFILESDESPPGIKLTAKVVGIEGDALKESE